MTVVFSIARRRKVPHAARWAFVSVLVLGLIASFVPDSIFAFPQPGHYFYGSVTIGNSSVREGTLIVARVGGLEYHTTTDALSRYGYHPNYFTIPADDPQTPQKEGASPGELIEFYINGIRASLYDVAEGRWWSSYPFESGGTSNLDLSVVDSQSWKVLLPIVMKR